MTNDELRRATQRLNDLREDTRRAVDDAAPASTPSSARVSLSFVQGDRVLDLRGGREGEVVDVGQANNTGQQLLRVKFDDGAYGLRDASDLVRRPSPPAGRK